MPPATKLHQLTADMLQLKSKYDLAGLQGDKVKQERILRQSVILNRRITQLFEVEKGD